MQKLLFFFALLLIFPSLFFAEEGQRIEEKRAKVALLVMATGRYHPMGIEMLRTAQQYFLPRHDRTFILFTDQETAPLPNTLSIVQPRLGWPYDTLKRYHVYDAHKELLKEMDYVYAIDADMLFCSEVGDEILSPLVAVEHYGFIGKMGPYCGNRKSKAYVNRKERGKYCWAAFYGGTKEEFLKYISTNKGRVDIDLDHHLIPKWHDEAYHNRYLVENPPTLLLGPAYCYPDGTTLPVVPKLISLQKKDIVALRK